MPQAGALCHRFTTKVQATVPRLRDVPGPMRLGAVPREQMDDGVSACGEQLSDQPAVAALPRRLGAEEAGRGHVEHPGKRLLPLREGPCARRSSGMRPPGCSRTVPRPAHCSAGPRARARAGRRFRPPRPMRQAAPDRTAGCGEIPENGARRRASRPRRAAESPRAPRSVASRAQV
jgi:hypothetical protein